MILKEEYLENMVPATIIDTNMTVKWYVSEKQYEKVLKFTITT